MSVTPWHCYCEKDDKCKHANTPYTMDCLRKSYNWKIRNVVAEPFKDWSKEK